MKWTVMRLSGARNLVRSLNGANGPEREREIIGSKRMTAPVEMRWHKTRDRR